MSAEVIAVPKSPGTIDVTKLPTTGFDTRSPLWWGNLLLLLIETTMFGILIATYFYVRMDTSPFPPPRVNRLPVIYDTKPDLWLPNITLAVLLLSLIPGIWLDLSARRKNLGAVKIGLIITLAFNVAAIILRFYEFDSLYFKWNDNAYASVVWTILGTHLLHLFVMACEDIYSLSWTFAKGLDDKHALDVSVMAVYWYWIVGIWVLLYGIVYWIPRVF